MSGISNDDSNRRPWPRAHEVSYCRVQLLRHMTTASWLRQELERLRSAMETDNGLVLRNIAEDNLSNGEDMDIGFSEMIEHMFSDPISVCHILYDGPNSELESYTKPYQYPYRLFETVTRLGLTKSGKPALWAVEKVHQVVRNGIESLVPELPYYWSLERHIEIQVTTNDGRVVTRQDVAEGISRTLSVHSVPRHEGTHERFGSDADWGHLRGLAVKAAEEAIQQVRAEFESQFVGPDRPMRNATRNEKWELLAQNIAFQLTGRTSGKVTSGARRHFCDLIGIDNPGVQKNMPK